MPAFQRNCISSCSLSARFWSRRRNDALQCSCRRHVAVHIPLLVRTENRLKSHFDSITLCSAVSNKRKQRQNVTRTQLLNQIQRGTDIQRDIGKSSQTLFASDLKAELMTKGNLTYLISSVNWYLFSCNRLMRRRQAEREITELCLRDGLACPRHGCPFASARLFDRRPTENVSMSATLRWSSGLSGRR